MRRLRAAANENHDIPVLTIGPTVGEFYEGIVESTNNGKKLPNWCVVLELRHTPSA